MCVSYHKGECVLLDQCKAPIIVETQKEFWECVWRYVWNDTIFRRNPLILYKLELNFLTNTVYHLKLELKNV
jgi:hypothetical protein